LFLFLNSYRSSQLFKVTEMSHRSLNKVRPAFFALIALAALAGCQMPPQKPTFPALTYAHKGPIVFNVARVDVVSTYVSPMKEPNVEHLSPVEPASAMMQWGHDRLQASGGAGLVRLTVKDAKIVDVPLPIQGGIQGSFTRQQSDKYVETIYATIEVFDGSGNLRGSANATAERSQTVAEGTPPAERDKVLFALTEQSMNDMDSGLEKAIRSNLGAMVQLP
jgi:hypothetical protein